MLTMSIFAFWPWGADISLWGIVIEEPVEDGNDVEGEDHPCGDQVSATAPFTGMTAQSAPGQNERREHDDETNDAQRSGICHFSHIECAYEHVRLSRPNHNQEGKNQRYASQWLDG
jgi:nitric oxide reductase activation protein